MAERGYVEAKMRDCEKHIQTMESALMEHIESLKSDVKSVKKDVKKYKEKDQLLEDSLSR